jgi:hypothetical protein
MPKAVGLCVWIILGISLVKWFRSPNPMDVTLDSFLKRCWVDATSLNLSNYKEHIGGEDSEVEEMFEEEGIVIRIPGTNITALTVVYIDYLVSIGHKVRREDPFTARMLGSWSSLSFLSKNDGDTFAHLIMYSPETGVATFSENVVGA